MAAGVESEAVHSDKQVSVFDQLHPHTTAAAEAAGQTIRSEAQTGADGYTLPLESIRNEMRRMTQSERVLVAKSMMGPGADPTLPTVKPEMTSTGDVTALNFETADHRNVKVNLADRPGEPHLSTRETVLPNGVLREVTTDQSGKLFSVDDSNGGAIRRNPNGGGDSYVRFRTDGTKEALEKVSVLEDGSLNFHIPGAEGVHVNTTERVSSTGDVISDVYQEGKSQSVVTEHPDGAMNITTSLPGTNGSMFAVSLDTDKTLQGMSGSLVIKYPDRPAQQFAADFREHPEALDPFSQAFDKSQSARMMDSDFWSKELANWKLPSSEM